MSAKSSRRDEFVEFALNRWSEWNRTGQVSLGYPRNTTIGRLIKEGPGAGQATGNPSMEMPELVQSVELAVRALPGDEKKAIKLKYIEINMNDENRAKKLRVSRAQYNIILDRARWFVRGRIA